MKLDTNNKNGVNRHLNYLEIGIPHIGASRIKLKIMKFQTI